MLPLRPTDSLHGLGLFTAAPATLTVIPADPGAGVTFQRCDLPGEPIIPALVTHLVPESRRTVLSADPADRNAPSVQTVEHLLSALAALDVTGARVRLTGPEVPILDGSAAPFVRALTDAGFHLWTNLRSKPLVLTETLSISDGAAEIIASPLPPLRNHSWRTELQYDLEYPPAAGIGRQTAEFTLEPGVHAQYAAAVAGARTFSTLAEAQAMQAAGMFAHLSPRDMLVIGPEGPIDNAYRFDNEPARHKLLDLIGDLALVGRPIHGRISARRTGHAHTHRLAKLLAQLA